MSDAVTLIETPHKYLCGTCGELVFLRFVTYPGVATPHSIQGMCCNERCSRHKVEFRMPVVFRHADVI